MATTTASHAQSRIIVPYTLEQAHGTRDIKRFRLGLLLACTSWPMVVSGCHSPPDETCEWRYPACAHSHRIDAGSGAAGAPSSPASLPTTRTKRHVIVMIGDGMDLADQIATSRYLHGSDYGLSFHAFPVMSYKTTWNVDVYDGRASALGVPAYSPESFDPRIGYDPALGGEAPYPIDDPETSREYFSFSGWLHPDSASTATAMSTGMKTDDGAIGWKPGALENGALETSPELLRRRFGMSIGFATTVPFSHATPAGFFAHNTSRENNKPIASEILTLTRPEVVIGGGWGSAYYDDLDLQRALASDDWVFTHQQENLNSNDALLAAAVHANQSNKRLLAIHGGGSLGDFVAPIPANDPGHPQIDSTALDRPTLPNASIAALEVLSRDPDGFFLLIEQGHIDWANHNSDFAKMVGCVAELDASVRAVEAFIERPNDDIDWSNTTLLVTADHANGYLRFSKTLGPGELPDQGLNESATPSYPGAEISYGSAGSHTAELVTVYAKGYAAARVHDYEHVYSGCRILDDTSIYRLTLDAASP